MLCFVIFALTHPKNHCAAAGDKHRLPLLSETTCTPEGKIRRRPRVHETGDEDGTFVGVVYEAHFRPAVPALIGATVFLLLCLYAPITQAGWNPARDFGPRLVAAAGGWGAVAIPGPRGGFSVYIAGPFLGGPVGAFLADKVLWG